MRRNISLVMTPTMNVDSNALAYSRPDSVLSPTNVGTRVFVLDVHDNECPLDRVHDVCRASCRPIRRRIVTLAYVQYVSKASSCIQHHSNVTQLTVFSCPRYLWRGRSAGRASHADVSSNYDGYILRLLRPCWWGYKKRQLKIRHLYSAQDVIVCFFSKRSSSVLQLTRGQSKQFVLIQPLGH